MPLYSKKVIKCFKNPRNYGKIKNPDGIGKVGNIICGDVMWLYIKIKKTKKKEIIKDIKFETFGCVAAIATSSVIADLAKEKTLEEALKITKENIINFLGGLPPIKLHCSILAIDALSEAIFDYLSKEKKEISKELQGRHKKIEQEKKIVEEKYKDWIKIEEQAHQDNKII
ncbi:iron-sulfur cluster assembly scaffold protein [Candidatus Kuenenbacteria bacterium]|nr:iron-sulfur cluster assembly scaffold protein [Candidatus Kuenenbacteria bacterium]